MKFFAQDRDRARRHFLWNYKKFGLDHSEVFTSLRHKFNTFQCHILNQEAFCFDVFEASEKAETLEELHQMLGERRKQRIEEVFMALGFVSDKLEENMNGLGGLGRARSRMGVIRFIFLKEVLQSTSLDALVQFLGTFIERMQLKEYEEWHQKLAKEKGEWGHVPKSGRTVIEPPPQWSSVWLEDYDQGYVGDMVSPTFIESVKEATSEKKPPKIFPGREAAMRAQASEDDHHRHVKWKRLRDEEGPYYRQRQRVTAVEDDVFEPADDCEETHPKIAKLKHHDDEDSSTAQPRPWQATVEEEVSKPSDSS